MFIRPKKGLIVRDPLNMIPININGQEVPENTFWKRRLKDGDVELVSMISPAGIKNKKEVVKNEE